MVGIATFMAWVGFFKCTYLYENILVDKKFTLKTGYVYCLFYKFLISKKRCMSKSHTYNYQITNFLINPF